MTLNAAQKARKRTIANKNQTRFNPWGLVFYGACAASTATVLLIARALLAN